MKLLETVLLTSVASSLTSIPTRVLTTPTADQERILRSLGMLHLVGPEAL